MNSFAKDPVAELAAGKELLEWSIEIGADEPIGDITVNRYELAARTPRAEKSEVIPETSSPSRDRAKQADGDSSAAETATRAARDSGNLDELRHALAAYEHCELKLGAQNLVFSDGNPQAKVMIIGEAPGAEEDRLGKPFVGRAGRLLDRMFAEIGLDRRERDASKALYISNVLPWRPPGNRDPTPDEIGMMKPFIRRHIELVDPSLLVLMGNISCSTLLGKRGITRLRGNWHDIDGMPVMPMFHPAYLLRNPVAKGDAWTDLLAIKKKLEARFR